MELTGYVVPGPVLAFILALAVKEHRRQKDGWNAEFATPNEPGIYLVRFHFARSGTSTTFTALWDGSMWCDISNGYACYFQALEWQPIRPAPSATSTTAAA